VTEIDVQGWTGFAIAHSNKAKETLAFGPVSEYWTFDTVTPEPVDGKLEEMHAQNGDNTSSSASTEVNLNFDCSTCSISCEVGSHMFAQCAEPP
jgi:hypothetical protein